MMPVVTHTAECLGERPVAKALGMSVTATATRGLGMSASAHSRSIMACSSGACSGSTTLAPIDLQGERVGEVPLAPRHREHDDQAEAPRPRPWIRKAPNAT